MPEVRDGRVYARGASDDKGNFLPLLHVACALARRGELPVHVRVLVEGEEEIGGRGVGRWVRDDERGADCAIVFDSRMADEHTPAITVGLRGIVQAHVTVRTGARDLHSGVYGGSVLNARTSCTAARRRPPRAPTAAARGAARRPRGAAGAELAACPRRRGAREAGGRRRATRSAPGAGDDYYGRTGAEASLDVNRSRGGEPRTHRARRRARHAHAAPRARPGRRRGSRR